jgi:hypothetical protein
MTQLIGQEKFCRSDCKEEHCFDSFYIEDGGLDAPIKAVSCAYPTEVVHVFLDPMHN